jgi:hypothetical protein
MLASLPLSPVTALAKPDFEAFFRSTNDRKGQKVEAVRYLRKKPLSKLELNPKPGASGSGYLNSIARCWTRKEPNRVRLGTGRGKAFNLASAPPSLLLTYRQLQPPFCRNSEE